MAKKYHIGENGIPAPCTAEIRSCRYGESAHGSREEIFEIAENLLKEQYVNFLEAKKADAKQSVVDNRRNSNRFSSLEPGDVAHVRYHRPAHMTTGPNSEGDSEDLEVATVSDDRIVFTDGTEIYKFKGKWSYGSGAYKASLAGLIPSNEVQRKPGQLAPKKITRDDFRSVDFHGMTYDQVAFDEEKQLEAYGYVAPVKGEADTRDQILEKAKKQWDSLAMTRAVIGEDVPVRLLPVGTLVQSGASKFSNQWKIGMPVRNGKRINPETKQFEEDISGSFHDGVQKNYVSPQSTFRVVSIPRAKITDEGKHKLPSHWIHENLQAAKLANARRQLEEHNSKFES